MIPMNEAGKEGRKKSGREESRRKEVEESHRLSCNSKKSHRLLCGSKNISARSKGSP